MTKRTSTIDVRRGPTTTRDI